jgi:hypothetical protein
MGMFMASAAFSKPEEAVWKNVKVRLVDFLAKQEGFTNNLDSQGSAFAIVSPYGDGGQILAAITPQISQLIGGIVVFATCCDSDFDLIEVYRNGELVEKCYIGARFEEFMEFGEYSKPNMEFWKNLLVDASREDELYSALFEEEVFAEDNLRKLSALTALPMFDDTLVFAE